jgi:hypothetical protein
MNVGPVIVAQNVGPIGSVDSGEESGACGDTGEVANAPDDAGTSRACPQRAFRSLRSRTSPLSSSITSRNDEPTPPVSTIQTTAPFAWR